MRYIPPHVGMFCAALAVAAAPFANAACCYFSAKDADVLQPAQKVFISYDPKTKTESFTVQPKFEGNALDFGMVIPTPSRPTLHEMPKQFFRHLAVYTILKQRAFPHSSLWPRPVMGGRNLGGGFNIGGGFNLGGGGFNLGGGGPPLAPPPPPVVRILETGVVGSLDYKVLEADRADALFQWLKTNKYHYAGDEATLHHYVAKKWCFTVMKIDTAAMKKNKDGSFSGEVTPTRFQFTSDKIVYPLKITQISVKDKTEALFYVQAPHKVDLPGDMTYQYTWAPMLEAAVGCTPGGIKGGGGKWFKDLGPELPLLLKRAKELGFVFRAGARPEANAKGHFPTMIEWARINSIPILKGEAPYSEKVPNVDEGINEEDMKHPVRGPAAGRIIQARLDSCRKERPHGYAVRNVPPEDVKGLAELVGHVQAKLFVTKFRKIFCRDEMNEDLVLIPAGRGDLKDTSQYDEVLPSSPP